ncbi:anhydro-N-acetylmuramic acid kinase [Paenibacillus sp. N3/727]|uniref:anhydro-N-acetylmuramic acid kinase n=1 Tax=Paenibacillus sp. N3/727 TaxID=2925845 RepID=UPI001F53A17E|nr:anhydro-N-acetylmuramic acid kinase [Paenibacillus sp. N3/727]UNK17851.1 anhydro-N-acetylmuramic acid kinase [Paenibacillus sp. N3/727]
MVISGWEKDLPVIVVGLMSGTSLDGIDAAVVRITGSGLQSQVELIHYASTPYDALTREKLKALCSVEHSSSASICSMNAYLGSLFGEAVLQAVSEAKLQMDDVHLISSHGQTVWHIPVGESGDHYSVPSTLQIGDISVIAKHTGTMVVGDFRPADMAVGGQGAPLVPYGDFILFRDEHKGRLLQNIGGIGNCSAIPGGAGPTEVLAFDTGPGNMVMDEVVYVLSGGRLSYDEEGRWAAQGRVDDGLLAEMMSHPYFHMTPPKSTGRELFGKDYASWFLVKAKERSLSDEDIIATATAFTAHSIADSYQKYVFPVCKIHEVIVSGGGAHNSELLRMLSALLPEQKVLTSAQLGFHDDAKEAVIFALLGNDFMHGIPNNLPAATGAERPTVMGKLALP